MNKTAWLAFIAAQAAGELSDLGLIPRTFEILQGLAAFVLLFPGNLLSDIIMHRLFGGRWTTFQFYAAFVPMELLINLGAWLLLITAWKAFRRRTAAPAPRSPGSQA